MAVEPAITSPSTTNKTEARVLCAKAKKTVSRTIAWIINAVRGESAAVSMGRKVEAALRFPQSGLIDGTTYLASALIPASANPRDTPAAMSVRKNRTQDSGNVLLPSLVSQPLLRDINEPRKVDDFISGNFNRDSRFAFGQAVVLSVFEHEGPIGTRRPLTGFSGDLLKRRCVGSQTYLKRIRSNLARLFLGQAFSRPRFRQIMIDTKHPAAAVDEYLKFFGTLGDITLETGESHEPVGRSQIGSNESFVCVWSDR